jgi:hypothetical protein
MDGMEGIGDRHEHLERAHFRICPDLDSQVILAVENYRQRRHLAEPDTVDPVGRGDAPALLPDRTSPAGSAVEPEGQVRRRRHRLAGGVLQVSLVGDGVGWGGVKELGETAEEEDDGRDNAT